MNAVLLSCFNHAFFFRYQKSNFLYIKQTEQCPNLSSLADGRVGIVLILVKTGWEGKVTEWGEAEVKLRDRMAGWRCAVPSSVHKMALEHRCYGNAPFKLPLHPRSPQAISITPSPPHTHITPFPSGSADSVISVCHVGQWRSAAGALRCTDWRSGVLGREGEEGGSNVEVGEKLFNELMLRSNSMWEMADGNFKLCLKFQTWFASQCSVWMTWRFPEVGGE